MTSMRYSAAAMAALLFQLGCVGEMITGPGEVDTDDGGDDGGGEVGGATSREMFEALNPQQITECGTCHLGANLNDTALGPDYLGANPQASHDTLMTYRSWQDGSPLVGDSPENSKLIVYGLHAGPPLSADLASKMTAWIAKRSQEAGAAPDDGGDDGGEAPVGGAPNNLVDALTQFASCMTYADFMTSGFQAVAEQQSAEGQCYGCHAAGTGGAFLAQDDVAFYDNQRKAPYILKFATGTVNEDGSFKELVPAGRYEQKQADNGHPNYLMDPARVQSIQQFFDLTKARYQQAVDSGTPCTPDTPVAVPPA